MFNPVFKPLPHWRKILVIGDVYVWPEPNASPHGNLKLIIKGNALFVSNQAKNIADNIRKTVMLTSWEDRLLLTPLSVKNLFASSKLDAQFNSYKYRKYFICFNDITKQHFLGEKQTTPFKNSKTHHLPLWQFAYITRSQLVLDTKLHEKDICWDENECNIQKDSWSLSIHKKLHTKMKIISWYIMVIQYLDVKKIAIPNLPR